MSLRDPPRKPRASAGRGLSFTDITRQRRLVACYVCHKSYKGGLRVVAIRADEYRRRAQQCLEMAGTFREREARVALSHMADAWLRLADRYREPEVRPPVQQQQQMQSRTEDKKKG
jgi:hypothetical protein